MSFEKQKLSLYVHTHWDREWYWAFERYRTLLVSVMKLVVQALEDGDLPNFHLDGQVCALEDFLELEPSYEDRVKKLNSKKRLAIGPWYVLADQMLVGGESLVRNMEFGLARARRFGEPMMVGYCPDTFGHSADLPRILKGFGIETAVVWRGITELDQGPEFAWRSPDGSEVIATLLAKGYHHTAFHEAEGSLAGDRIDTIVEALLPWLSLKWHKEKGVIVETTEPSRVYSRNTLGCLVPVGGDHQKPPARMKELIKNVEERLNGLLEESGASAAGLPSAVELEPVQLPGYMKMVSQAVRKPGTPLRLIEGELRENKSALQHSSGYMLPGVLSTRLYLKRANRMLEHRLSRVSEPLYSLMTLAGLSKYPMLELANCWKYMLKNHPHDSMCGCSVDDVHREMMPRFASVDHVLDVLDQRVRQDLLVPGVHQWSHDRAKEARNGKSVSIENAGFGRGCMDLADPDVPLTGLAVFNLSLEAASSPVKVSLALPSKYLQSNDQKWRCHQDELLLAAERYLSDVLDDRNAFQIDTVGFETELFGEAGGVPLYKDVNYVRGWLWAADVAPLAAGRISLQKASQKTEARALASSSVATDSASRSGDAIQRRSDPGADTHRQSGSAARAEPVGATRQGLSNGFFDVRVGQDGGIAVTVKLADHRTISYSLGHKLQDVADAGDSYNFDPVAGDVPVVARMISWEVGKSGPLIGSIRITYKLDLPAGLKEDQPASEWSDMEGGKDLVAFKRSDCMIEHEIVTEVTLKRGVPLVFFDTDWVNGSTDHRLEVVFNTGSAVSTTWSENHYSLVERKAKVKRVDLPVIKCTEAPLDRFPCQRFFVANGQAFFNLGLPEYGVDGDTVSITLLRAISMLSRRRLLTRGGGAGPYMPVPDGNCLGENIASYAWAPLSVLDNTASSKADSLDDCARAAAYRLAERFEGSLWSTPLTPESDAALTLGSAVQADNASIRLTALYSNDEGKSLLLRLLNVSMKPQHTELSVQDDLLKLQQVDLSGRKTSDLPRKDGKVKVSFGPNELLTLQLSL